MTAVYVLIGLGIAAASVLMGWRRHPPPGHAFLVRRRDRTEVSQAAVWAKPGQAFPIDLSARTVALNHRRRNALSCQDGIRAEVRCTVTLSVTPERDAILRAADVLGPDLGHDGRVVEHFRPRFEQALRAALHQQPFAAWAADLEGLSAAVTRAAGLDLDGFRVEAIAIERFEQAPLDAHDPENALDAQGIRALTALIEAERTRTEAVVQAATLERARNELAAKRELAVLDEELAQYGGASESVLDRLRARRAAQAEAETDDDDDADVALDADAG